MAGNTISHFGEPVQTNDAVRLRSANECFLRRDETNWMRKGLFMGGRRIRGMADPREDQDGVNKRTLQASEAHVSERGFPTWGTCTPRGTFAYPTGYI